MARLTKNTSVLLLGILMVFTLTAEAQWSTGANFNQIRIWFINGNLNNDYLQQYPLQFTVVAAFIHTVGTITYYDAWIIVSKKKQQICHVKGHKHIKNKYIRTTWIQCYKCKKLKKSHHSSKSYSDHKHSSSSSSSSKKHC